MVEETVPRPLQGCFGHRRQIDWIRERTFGTFRERKCPAFAPSTVLTNRYLTMLLVNVGSHTINIDHVVAFVDKDTAIDIIFSDGHPGQPDDESRFVLTLSDEEADRMRAWLERNAEGVRGTEQTGFHIG